MGRLVEMVIESVRVHMLSNRHVVILKDGADDRYLPIWIGAWEASAIAMRLQGLAAERPLTHDLFVSAIDLVGVRVARIVISELSDETYHARLILEQDGVEVEVDARPSDALAIAVRSEAPIYADEAVLEVAALSSDPDEEAADAGGEAIGDSGEPGSPGRPRTMGTEDPERRRRRRVPLESVGDAPADPRLDMFRDFVNSLEVDPGSGGDTGPKRG